MAYESSQPLSIDASGDLSASQYCGMKIDTNGQLALPAAGGQIIGILQTKPSAVNRPGTVLAAGRASRAKMGATVAAGDPVKVDASGRFVTAVATNIAHGFCLEGGAINEIGTVFLTGPFTV